ncbi:hypothetical protein ACFL96_07220 [Thermoproteota archaeon]
MMFFGFCMFVIGAIVGRLTMAIQYEVMKTVSRNKPKKTEIYRPKQRKRPEKLEYNTDKAEDNGSKKEFYDFMNKRP